jgi:hypothetical protein
VFALHLPPKRTGKEEAVSRQGYLVIALVVIISDVANDDKPHRP